MRGEAAAVCGVMITFSILQSGWPAGNGSVSKTSKPAPAMSPACNAAVKSRKVDDHATADID